MSEYKPRQWSTGHPDGGRVDVDGVEWFAGDPYPTWHYWKDQDLITPRNGEPVWKDVVHRKGRVNDKLYVLVTEDRCVDRSESLGCGYPESEHPFHGRYGGHEFKRGATRFVEATREQVEEYM